MRKEKNTLYYRQLFFYLQRYPEIDISFFHLFLEDPGFSLGWHLKTKNLSFYQFCLKFLKIATFCKIARIFKGSLIRLTTLYTSYNHDKYLRNLIIFLYNRKDIKMAQEVLKHLENITPFYRVFRKKKNIILKDALNSSASFLSPTLLSCNKISLLFFNSSVSFLSLMLLSCNKISLLFFKLKEKAGFSVKYFDKFIRSKFVFSVTLSDLRRELEVLLEKERIYFKFAIKDHCNGVRQRLKKLSSVSTSEDPIAVLILLLRCGLLNEALFLATQKKLKIPLVWIKFLKFTCQAYKIALKKGKQFRATGATHQYVISSIVWGAEYTHNFIEFNLRSMLAEGNLINLSQNNKVTLFIITTSTDKSYIKNHPLYKTLSSYASIEFFLLPKDILQLITSPEMKSYFYVLYGMLDHIGIYFTQGAQANLFLIPVDSIISCQTFSSFEKYIKEGFITGGGGNIVAKTETFLPALKEKFRIHKSITITTEELAALALCHSHHYFNSQIVSHENKDFGLHPRELFWAEEEGIFIHSIFIHPLFISRLGLKNYQQMHYCNVDYGLIPRIVRDPGKIKILPPSEAYINNFSSEKRLHECTGVLYKTETLLRAHAYSYIVQKSLFSTEQYIKCSPPSIAPLVDRKEEINKVMKMFGLANYETV